MKLLIIRHGDPDYELDSLTEKGLQEVEYLAERIAKLEVKEFYISSLGRAQKTAGATLKKMNRTGTTYEWLREFWPRIKRPNRKNPLEICWDWYPSDWANEDSFYHLDHWGDDPVMKEAHVQEEAEMVYQKLDEILDQNGYKREGRIYRAHHPNNDTIVFFCHMGMECVLLSHLLNISPMVLWHNTCAAPSSVTTVVTEERLEGIASFRMTSYGDISHLYAHGEKPSFSGRFCETYQNKEERHY